MPCTYEGSMADLSIFLKHGLYAAINLIYQPGLPSVTIRLLLVYFSCTNGYVDTVLCADIEFLCGYRT